MKQDDKRQVCTEEKRAAIRNALATTRSRRLGQVVRCFELKVNFAKLNKVQKEQLKMLFVEAKWFYNHVLAYKKENDVPLSTINTTEIREVKHFDRDKNEVVSELRFLGAQHKQAILGRMVSNEKTIRSLVKAGYQKRGGLKFKSEVNVIPLVQFGSTHKFKGNGLVKLLGIKGTVRVKGFGQLAGVDEFANANLVQKPDGYYLKVTCYIDRDNFKEVKPTKNEIGLDFGIKTNITTSEGDRIDISVGESERLKVLQRKLQRQAKGSNNRKKTVHQIQVAYQKQTNKKKDKCNKFIHKMKYYKAVVIQDEQLTKWHSEKGMSKVVQHSCMGMIKARLKTMRNVVVLENNIPTTKWCPCCGKVNELTLNDRQYVCGCGRSLDRDLHAAQNMLKIAHLVLGNNLVSLPTEHREVKRVEFLSKTKTMKHEADTL